MSRFPRVPRRVWLVAAVAVAMGVAGTYQFVWSSLRPPVGARLEVSGPALGTVFTLFVAAQTVSQFPAGWVRDRRGPRLPLAVGGLLLGVGYAGVAFAPSLAVVAVCYTLGGVGSGAVYTVAINTPVKWFDDRRGLATGVVGFAYAGGSVLLIPLVRGSLTREFRLTVLALAGLCTVLALAAVPVVRDPEDGQARTETAADGGPDATTGAAEPAAYSWRETVRTWQFWVLYGAFVVVNGVGLMVIGKVVAFAEAMSLPGAATAAASVVALGDGAGVVLGGGVADRLGGERTMAASLVVCALALAGATVAAGAGLGLAFVGLVALSAAARSPAFAVFPGLVGEYYGTARSSENYAALYSAKLWGGVVGGAVTSGLVAALGWTVTFLLGAGLLVVAAAGMAVLRPVRR